MRKLKIKRRIENSINAFFDESLLNENSIMTFNETYVLDKETNLSDANKSDILKTLKQPFLFLPSAFYLFFGTLAFFMFGSVTTSRLVILVGLIGSFILMVFGIGDVKKLEHFLMPLSVIALGTLTFLVFSVSGIPTHVWSQKYAVYVFPLALIIPFLVKGLIDKDS